MVPSFANKMVRTKNEPIILPGPTVIVGGSVGLVDAMEWFRFVTDFSRGSDDHQSPVATNFFL
jgi:hypothetical protein